MLTAIASRARALVAVLCLACVTCHPQPPSPSTPVQVSTWTDTARTVLVTVRWSVPAAKVVVGAVVSEPGRSTVLRSLDGVAEAADGLQSSLDAYEHAGGDQCAAKAAVAGLSSAIVSLARTLADNGIALGSTLERVADSVGSIADALVPACDRDAGWSSAGVALGVELRRVQSEAVARGRVLRHVLDDLQPMDGGAL
jgi:hypothetical protein